MLFQVTDLSPESKRKALGYFTIFRHRSQEAVAQSPLIAIAIAGRRAALPRRALQVQRQQPRQALLMRERGEGRRRLTRCLLVTAICRRRTTPVGRLTPKLPLPLLAPAHDQRQPTDHLIMGR